MITKERFVAIADYAESMFQSALNNIEVSIEALERSVEDDPHYAPAIFSMATVRYKQKRASEGKTLILSLLSLPAGEVEGGEKELVEIIDEAGCFLIQSGEYEDGLYLYRAAAERFSHAAVLWQGVGCCAGHMDQLDEAITASKEALEIEPDNPEFVNDLGWSIFQAGRFEEAREVLRKATDMDPNYNLARENLKICKQAIVDGFSDKQHY